MRPPVVAIIGAGQGGFQTAASLREAGFDGAVVLIGEEAGLPYERPPLSKSYLAGTLPPERLWLRPQAFYDKEKIAYLAGETVAAIDRPGRRLRLASGREIACDHIVLATGARCRPLPVPGAELACARALPPRASWSSSAPALSASKSPPSPARSASASISSS
jgi:3-phenylpropionate/trans-cinnamate dioxygenase ferredoxin reductase subunit